MSEEKTNFPSPAACSFEVNTAARETKVQLGDHLDVSIGPKPGPTSSPHANNGNFVSGILSQDGKGLYLHVQPIDQQISSLIKHSACIAPLQTLNLGLRMFVGGMWVTRSKNNKEDRDRFVQMIQLGQTGVNFVPVENHLESPAAGLCASTNLALQATCGDQIPSTRLPVFLLVIDLPAHALRICNPIGYNYIRKHFITGLSVKSDRFVLDEIKEKLCTILFLRETVFAGQHPQGMNENDKCKVEEWIGSNFPGFMIKSCGFYFSWEWKSLDETIAEHRDPFMDIAVDHWNKMEELLQAQQEGQDEVDQAELWNQVSRRFSY